MLYHTAFNAAGNVISSNRRLRIVRRTTGFTWAGAVHEDLVVVHRKPDNDSEPSGRNLAILENLMSSGQPVRPVDVLNYARELEMHKRFAEAVPHYEEFLATFTTCRAGPRNGNARCDRWRWMSRARSSAAASPSDSWRTTNSARLPSGTSSP